MPELVWVSQEHMEMGAMDKVGQPGGLGWPGSMRLGTGATLLGAVWIYFCFDLNSAPVGFSFCSRSCAFEC